MINQNNKHFKLNCLESIESDSDVIKKYNPDCSDKIKEAFDEIEKLLTTKEGQVKLQQIFG